MNLEEKLDRSLRECIYDFLKNLYFFLSISFFLLSLYFFFKNTVVIGLVIFYFSLILFFVRRLCIKKNTVIASFFLIFLFLSFSIYLSFVQGLFFHGLLLILMSFFLYLILFNKLDFHFFAFLLLIIIMLFCNFFSHEGIGNTEYYKDDLFIKLLLYWIILLFLYVLFKGCIFMKICQEEVLNNSKKYKYLANMEYRNRLLGRISKCILHDICTPVTVLSGYLNENSSEKKGKEHICKETVVGPLIYIENILTRSLDILKTKSIEKEFDSADCISKMIRILKTRLNRSEIDLEIDLLENKKLKGDCYTFNRIFLNLFINAIEELEISRKSEKKIKIETYIQDDTYVLSIRDNGRGFKKDILERISSNDLIMEEENLGLGLFFVLTAVKENFKGKVVINSTKWKYSEVKVIIPL